MDQDQHRDKARECVALAGQARGPKERLELLDMAQAFLRLAAFTAQRREEKSSASRAFFGKVVAGSPSESATNQ